MSRMYVSFQLAVMVRSFSPLTGDRVHMTHSRHCLNSLPPLGHQSIQHKYQLIHCMPPGVLKVINILVLKPMPFRKQNVTQNKNLLSVAYTPHAESH